MSEYTMLFNSLEKQFKTDYNNILMSFIDAMGYDIEYK